MRPVLSPGPRVLVHKSVQDMLKPPLVSVARASSLASGSTAFQGGHQCDQWGQHMASGWQELWQHQQYPPPPDPHIPHLHPCSWAQSPSFASLDPPLPQLPQAFCKPITLGKFLCCLAFISSSLEFAIILKCASWTWTGEIYFLPQLPRAAHARCSRVWASDEGTIRCVTFLLAHFLPPSILNTI